MPLCRCIRFIGDFHRKFVRKCHFSTILTSHNVRVYVKTMDRHFRVYRRVSIRREQVTPNELKRTIGMFVYSMLEYTVMVQSSHENIYHYLRKILHVSYGKSKPHLRFGYVLEPYELQWYL